MALYSDAAKHYKVVVVGAGVAGCTATKWLIEKGVDDVRILEASDRIGGRINTIHTSKNVNLLVCM